MDIGHAESLAILLDHFATEHVRVLRHDYAGVIHQLRDEGSFSPGRRAQIEDGLSGLRVQKGHRQQGAGVLHIEKALLKARHGRESGMRLELKDQIAFGPIELSWNETDLFFLPNGRDLFDRRFECIGPGEGSWRGVVPLKQLACEVGAPALLPAFPKPFRMGVASGRVFLLESFERLFGGFSFAQVASQDGVDEPGLRSEAVAPGQFDGFIDGRMIGNAIEPKHLVKPKTQKDLQERLLRAARSFGRDQPIKRSLPTNHAKGEFLYEAAVRRQEYLSGQLIFEDFLDELLPDRMPLEHGNGNFSWFFATHSLIMTVAQLQARTYIGI